MSEQSLPLHQRSASSLLQALAKGEVSSVELTRHYLQRIERLDPRYNSLVTVTADQALAEAQAADEARAQGAAGPLCGLPIVHKDVFCTEGVRTSCGSRMLDNFLPPYDAAVVERLRQAGAVMLGKANMDEFAMGSSNETSYYGPTCNPWAPHCSPGGSSGGSAAAVAARLASAATGSDTGGSIRQPAALSGITGLKPTYGRISRWGMVAMASSLDHAGPMTQSAEDAARLLQAMAGLDPRDATSADEPVPDYCAELAAPLDGLRLGLPRQYFETELPAATARQVRAALAELEQLGARLVDIELPHAELAMPCYRVLATAEASSNLARYDGVRYGYRCSNPADLDDLYRRSRSEALGPEVQRRILMGTLMLSSACHDSHFRQAQRVRRLIRNDFVQAFHQVDLIVGPTSPGPAFALQTPGEAPERLALQDVFTIGANLAGLPALSLPCGLVDALPVGLQLIGPDFAEARLLNVGHRYQQVTDWHRRCAPDID